MIKSFGGINISSKNTELLAKFYNEKLGVPIFERPCQAPGSNMSAHTSKFKI